MLMKTKHVYRYKLKFQEVELKKKSLNVLKFKDFSIPIQHVWDTSNNKDNWKFTEIKVLLQKPSLRVLHTEIIGTSIYSNNCENPGIHVNKLYG
jgi:hypothetical protein